MSDFCNIVVRFNVRLETSVENVATNVVNVLSEEFCFDGRSGLIEFILGSQKPAIHFRHPTNIGFINEQHSCSGYSGRSSIFQVRYFKDQSHRRSKGNTIVRHQSKYFVIIHNSVK